MGGAGEEIEGGDFFDFVFFCEDAEVAGLGGRVARKINDFFWGNFEEFFEKFDVAAGAGRIDDYGLVWLDEV